MLSNSESAFRVFAWFRDQGFSFDYSYKKAEQAFPDYVYYRNDK